MVGSHRVALRVWCFVSVEHARDWSERLAESGCAISVFACPDRRDVALVEAWPNGEDGLRDFRLRLALLAEVACLAQPQLSIEYIPHTDWVSENLASFPPIRVGRIELRGCHIVGDVPASVTVLTVDAGLAFGTGDHPSTRACLLALQDIAQRSGRGKIASMLDVGTGTAILAMAMARLRGRVRIVASEIDPFALSVASSNVRRNGLQNRIRLCGDTALFRFGRRSGFGVIFANISPRVLLALAPRLVRYLRPGGRLVLAGITAGWERRVLSAYRARGLVLRSRMADGGWRCLVLAAKNGTARL